MKGDILRLPEWDSGNGLCWSNSAPTRAKSPKSPEMKLKQEINGSEDVEGTNMEEKTVFGSGVVLCSRTISRFPPQSTRSDDGLEGRADGRVW